MIAGSKAGVDKACELLKAAGAKRTLPLPVSAPFHSPLMKPAADRLREKLATVAIDAPYIPVIDNIDVRSETEPAAIRDALYRQAYGPVRWEETIRAIRARGVDRRSSNAAPARCSPNLTRRIDAGSESAAVHDPASLRRRPGAARMSDATSAAAAQVALVTGASRGIGRAIATTLAQKGFRVVGTATTDGRRRAPSARRWPPSRAAAASSSTSPTATRSARRSMRS